MTPKLENKALSAKSIQYNMYMRLERRKEFYKPALGTRKQGM